MKGGREEGRKGGREVGRKGRGKMEIIFFLSSMIIIGLK